MEKTIWIVDQDSGDHICFQGSEVAARITQEDVERLKNGKACQGCSTLAELRTQLIQQNAEEQGSPNG